MTNWLPAGITLRSLLENERIDFDRSVQRPTTTSFLPWTHPGSHDSGIGNSPCFDLSGGLFNNNDHGLMQKQHQIWGGFGGLDISVSDHHIIGNSCGVKDWSSNGGWPDVTAAASLIMCATKSAGDATEKPGVDDQLLKFAADEVCPTDNEQKKQGKQPQEEESRFKDGSFEAKEGQIKEEN